MLNSPWETLLPPYTIVDRPLWWHVQGLQQTASGYGSKLTTRYCLQLPNGKIYRIYCTCYSNIGTCWIRFGGQTYTIPD